MPTNNNKSRAKKMATELIAPQASAPIDLGVADRVIAGLAGRLSQLKEADTPSKYESVRQGIAECRTLRAGVEKSRKELKESALEYGRKVDAEAKRVKAAILQIEEPLKAVKAAVDEEKERQKQAKLEEERRKAEEEARKKREEEERIAAAERERIRKQQAEEAARLAKEREALEAERAEQRRKQQEARQRIEADRKKLEEERAAVREQQRIADEKERKEREAEHAKKDAAEAARQKRIREEVEAKRKAEAEAAAKARLPDSEKLTAFVNAVDAVPYPTLTTEWGQSLLDGFILELGEISRGLEKQIACSENAR
jgi:DNA repair exonuclease SbcCD ATPase subunit